MKYTIASRNLAFSGEGVADYFRLLNAAAARHETDYLVVGAFARDLLLTRVLGGRAGAQTEDVDIGIHLKDWHTYRQVVNDMLRQGYRKGRSAHVYFGPVGLRTDLLPFGPVEERRHITFADTDHISMNMMGFTEAFPRRLIFELEDGTVFNTPDVAGMLLLKLSAWNDLYPWNKATKHVRDIGLLMEAFFDGTVDLLDTDPFYLGVFDRLPDPQPIYHSAIVLGRQVRAQCANYPETLEMLQTAYTKIASDERALFIQPFAHAIIADRTIARQTITYLFEAILAK